MMRSVCRIAAMVLFAACAATTPAAADSEPVGMGVSNGNLLKDWPFLEIVASEGKCIAGEFGDADLLADARERGVNKVKFVAGVKSEQLAALFDGARQLAVSNRVSFYGISDLKQDAALRGNHVRIESCGEMLALRKGAQK